MRSWVGDIIVISDLAMRVHITYKDTPNCYKHISEEVAVLRTLIEKVAQHFKRSAISKNDCHEGQKVLEGCQSVLKDLYSLMEKYKSRASTHKGLPFLGAKFGEDNIVTLRERLVFNTGLLHGFNRRCEYIEIQTELASVLSFHHSRPRIPATAIATFAANTDRQAAYKRFCKDLNQIGVAKQMILLEEDEILDILKFEGVGASDCIGLGDSNISDQDHNSSSAMVKLSLPIGCRPDQLMYEARRGDNSALLDLIARNSHIGTVGLLFGKGASIDRDKNTLLHCAARGGFTETVKLLLEKGAPVEAADKEGYTPLHIAAMGGHAGVVEVLLAKGAAIEAVDTYNWTPLHFAAWRSRTETVELLLGRGAAIEAVNKRNSTPLHIAAKQGHMGIVELLLAKGAAIEAVDKSNWTPLHFAAWRSHTETVELLLERGASIEAANRTRSTPLHLAAGTHRTGVVRVLLAKGAAIEAVDKCNWTPLHFAAKLGIMRTVELLLAKGASIEAASIDKSTPLHFAAANGHVRVVEVLLGKGASVEAVNESNQTPLQVAAQKGHTEVVELLNSKAIKAVVHGDHA